MDEGGVGRGEGPERDAGGSGGRAGGSAIRSRRHVSGSREDALSRRCGGVEEGKAEDLGREEIVDAVDVRGGGGGGGGGVRVVCLGGKLAGTSGAVRCVCVV